MTACGSFGHLRALGVKPIGIDNILRPTNSALVSQEVIAPDDAQRDSIHLHDEAFGPRFVEVHPFD